MAIRQIGIVVKTTVVGLHAWPECPHFDVAFLRDSHRHTFHVTCKKRVAHSDRDIEIIRLKRDVDAFLDTFTGPDGVRQFGRRSCEDIAVLLADRYSFEYVEVLEDNENGGYCVAEFEDIHDTVRPYCFTGVEAEGPHQGDNVLFVGGSVDPAVAFDAFVAATKLEQIQGIYFGAGNDHELRQDTYEILTTLADRSGMHFVVEVCSNAPFNKLLPSHVVVRLQSNNEKAYEGEWVKHKTDTALVWKRDGQEISTILNDSRFKTDKRIR